MLFGFYWVSQLLLAMQQFLISSCVVIWFLHERNPTAPLLTSLWRMFRYHFGSLALGSFIIAIVQMAQAVLNYVEYKCVW